MAVKVDFKPVEIEFDFLDILKQTGEETADLLEQDAPVDKGVYKSGFTSQMAGKGNDAKVYAYNDSKEKSLSHILEFGTPTIAPQPHYRTAYVKMEKRYVENMKKTKIIIK